MSEKLPLAGKQFLITRPLDQAAEFVSLLEQQGGTAICIPTIEIVPPDSLEPFDFVMRDLEDFDILILTSVNGVEVFFDRLVETNQYFGTLTDMLVVAVGPKTAAAIQQHCIRPNLIPADHRAEGVVAELLQYGVEGKRILYPRAEIARPLIIDSLQNAGAEVIAPIAYRTVMPAGSEEQIRNLLTAGSLDAICFSSSSTFNNLMTMIGDDLVSLQGDTKLFSIGPQTSATIREHGFHVDLEPESWTLDALVLAMVKYYSA
ncbi:MAG: uroporphyrinogen-III synthase [Desulfuromonadales bacterium]|nr:uroporphyrinogen-III synthase [Desulfuromonadales bacterium]